MNKTQSQTTMNISPKQITHFDGCWAFHLSCAIAKIRKLEAGLKQIAQMPEYDVELSLAKERIADLEAALRRVVALPDCGQLTPYRMRYFAELALKGGAE